MTRYKAKCEMQNGKLVTLTFKENSKEDVKSKINKHYNVKYILSIYEEKKGKHKEKIEFYSGMDRSSYPYIKNSNGKSIRIYG